MKKSITFFSLVTLVLGIAMANEKLSLSTQVFLTNLHEETTLLQGSTTQLKSKSLNAPSKIDAFIKLTGSSTAQLRAAGVDVYASFGDFVTASIPVDAIEKIADLDEVAEISVANPVELNTDSMRVLTHVEQVQNGYDYGMESSYDGTGVVLGIIDSGFDFNHKAFQDKDGHTRIKRVYFPKGNGISTSSSKVTLNDGTVLPGVAYDSAAVSTLTTDRTSSTHGTHTLGIAAGTRVGPYSGMAPGADIVVCSLGGNGYEYSSQVNVAHSANFIIDYAKSVGKPCVISISAGSTIGPRDGSTYLCKVYDALSEYDPSLQRSKAIFCLSAGNQAGIMSDFQHLCTNTDSSQLQFGLMPVNRSTTFASNVSLHAYGEDLTPFGVQYLIFDPSNDSLVYQTAVMKTYQVIYGGEANITHPRYDAELSKYFSGRIAVWQRSTSGRYEIETETRLNDVNPDKHYKIALQYYAPAGTKIYGMGENTAYFAPADSIGPYGFIAGNDSCCMNDDATARSVISVGAYASKNEVTSLNGYHSKLYYKIGQITNYSSYGMGLNGIPQPFVVAPGCLVISGLNSYSPYASVNSSMSTYYSKNDATGKTNFWGRMDGTSMATPCVAGTIALWLQAHPHWTVDSVKENIRRTAIVDDFVTNGGIRYGHGKINALGGLPALQNTLAKILNNPACHEDSVYRIAGHSLTCVFVSRDGKTIYAKDDNMCATPDVIASGEVDYLKTQTSILGNAEECDQSNWVAIQLAQPLDSTSRKQYPGHYLNPVTGRLLLKYSPVIEALETPTVSSDTSIYVTNGFIPANLAGTQRVAMSEAGDSATYFFVRPKAKEICTIGMAMWNARDSVFEIPNNADSIVMGTTSSQTPKISMKGLKGSFRPHFTLMEEPVPALEDKGLYKFLALVDKQQVSQSAGAMQWDYAVYPLKKFQKLDYSILQYDSLAAILRDSTYRVGEKYSITDNTLICAYVSPDGRTIYAKDDNRYMNPDVMEEGQVDFDLMEAKRVNPKDSLRYDQSNWAIINLPAPLDSTTIVHYTGRYLTGLTGTLVSKENPELDADLVPQAGGEKYAVINRWSAAHFYGTQRVLDSLEVDSVTYFFVRPKPLEIDSIVNVMWNAQKQTFEVPTWTDSVTLADNSTVVQTQSYANLKGSFKADFTKYNGSVPELLDKHLYKFLAFVRKEKDNSTAIEPQLVAYPLESMTDLGEYVRTDTLVNILSRPLYREGHRYGIADSTLVCAYVSRDGKMLIAKDDNGFLTPDVIAPGQVDYMKVNTDYLPHDSSRYDQSNWLLINLPVALDSTSRANYPGKFLAGFVGRLNSKLNPAIDAVDSVGVKGKTLPAYEENTFLPASFMGSQQVTDSTGAQVSDYFFVRPKAMEVAMIDLAMWNKKSGLFEMPFRLDSVTINSATTVQQVSISGLHGSFKVDFSMFNDTIPALIDGHHYKFLAQVRKDTVAATAGGAGYVVYPLGKWDDCDLYTLLGDANGDDLVDVGDVTAIINRILGMNPQPFIWGNSDVNSDGIIDVADVTAVINIILKL